MGQSSHNVARVGQSESFTTQLYKTVSASYGSLKSWLSSGAHPTGNIESSIAPPFASYVNSALVLDSPSNLNVTSTSGAPTPQVVLSWTASTGTVDHYEVERSNTISGPFLFLGSSSTTSLTDSTAVNLHAYLYRVRAIGSNGLPSVPSNLALGTAISFEFSSLQGQVLKAQHFYDLRTAINAVRAVANLSAASWGRSTLQGQEVLASDVQELRNALDPALSALGISVSAYQDSSLSGVLIKGIHLEQLQARSTKGVSSGAGPVTDLITARLDPMNQTGGGGENPLSRNYNWNLPLVNLPGRSGLDLSLGLSYNSLVWTRSGNFMSFDDDHGFPSPGFRLGFPTLQPMYFNPEVGTTAFLLIGSDGSRTELRQVSSSELYESADSAHVLLDTSTLLTNGSMTLRTTDGTQLKYEPTSSEYQCTEIKDRNGNYLTINYTSLGNIDTVVDTLNRTIKFNYNQNDHTLISITQTWLGGEHTWASFSYLDNPTHTNFGSLTKIGPGEGSQVKVLSRVTLADNSHYDFLTTSWQQVWKITNSATDDHLLNYRAYNLKGDVESAESDCPRFTQRHDWAENWNRSGSNGPAGVPNGTEEEVLGGAWSIPSSTQFSFPGSTEQHDGIIARVTAADGTYNEIYYEGMAGTDNGWRRDLPAMTNTFGKSNPGASVTKQRASVTTWKQDDETSSYLVNPRVEESILYDFDSSGSIQNKSRTTISYQTLTVGDGLSCKLPGDVIEYQADGTTELRRSNTTYLQASAYLARRLIGLPLITSLYEFNPSTQTETLLSKTGFDYDETGSIIGSDTATQHDNTSVSARGNVSTIKRYDTSPNSSASLASHVFYNTAGSTVKTADSASHEVLISYTDQFFSDSVNQDASRPSTLAYPSTVTDPDGFTTKSHYNYDFGAVTWTQIPKPNEITNQPGPAQRFTFDSIGRIQQSTNLVNSAYTKYQYGPNYIETLSSVNNLADEGHTLAVFDGVGRTIATARNHPGSDGGFSGQLVVYNAMGRVFKRSNPTETSVSISGVISPYSWLPTGDDSTTNGFGWVYTTQSFDWKGRPLVTTNPDSTTKEASYEGCGCAGGQVVTLTDEGAILGFSSNATTKKRQQKIYSDVLGRAVKTEAYNWDGSGPNGTAPGNTVYSTTINTYNALNQLTNRRAYDGGSQSSTFQDKTLTYDGFGRLKTRHTPEQQIDTNNSLSTDHTSYEYFDDDTIKKVTDPRGATSTFEYNNRHLVRKIVYTAPQGVQVPSQVDFSYDALGNKLSMSDGSGNTQFEYTALSKLRSETHQIVGLGSSSTLAYEYNLLGALKKITNANGTYVDYGYDQAGQVSSITGTLNGSPVTYATGLEYRASGALKHLVYGSGKSLDVSFDQQYLPSHLAVSGLISKNYEYHPDGRIKYSADLIDNRFDRFYGYDQEGRISLAYSGPAARGLTDTADRPYKQTYVYDAMNHLQGRLGRLWNGPGGGIQSGGTYVNNRSTDSTWHYDANGNLSSNDDQHYTFDAANRMVTATSNSDTRTQTNTIDGLGVVTKQVDVDANLDQTDSYQIYSSVTNAINTTITVNASGQQSRTFIYLNGEVIASQIDSGVAQAIEFEYRDATNATYITSTGRHDELDPLGNNAGIHNPYTIPNPAPSEDRTYPGIADLLSGHCLIDKVPAPCDFTNRMLRSGVGREVEAGTAITDGLPDPPSKKPVLKPGEPRGPVPQISLPPIKPRIATTITVTKGGIIVTTVKTDGEGTEITNESREWAEWLPTAPPEPQKLPPPSGCAKFVDKLMDFVDRLGVSATQRAVGAAMAVDAKYKSGPLAHDGKLDFSGFKPELIAGEQNGWAMVHIQGMAGVSLAGAHDEVERQFREDRNQLALGVQYQRAGRKTIPYGGEREYPLDRFMAEKRAEITDDEYGIYVAGILQNKIDGRKTAMLVKIDLLNLLCDSVFNPPLTR
jgi:YD repeat-containing protein